MSVREEAFQILMKSILPFFEKWFVLYLFCEILAYLKISKIFFMFPSTSFIDLGFAFRFMIHFELIFVCRVKIGWDGFVLFCGFFSPGAYGYPILLHHLLKSNPFFIELPWVLCWKSADHGCVEIRPLIRLSPPVTGESGRDEGRFLGLERGWWGGVPSHELLSDEQRLEGRERELEGRAGWRYDQWFREKESRPTRRARPDGWAGARPACTVSFALCLTVLFQALGKWRRGSPRLRVFHRQEWKTNRKVSKGVCLDQVILSLSSKIRTK